MGCRDDAPMARDAHGAEQSHPALQTPASDSGVHRVKPCTSVPGGPCIQFLLQGDAPVAFPALLPTLTLRGDSAEPRAELHRPRGRGC